jgi:hypothetical protein
VYILCKADVFDYTSDHICRESVNSLKWHLGTDQSEGRKIYHARANFQ